MSNFENNLDKLVSKILNEEIENKVKQISEEMGEWTEIEVDEELKGQKVKSQLLTSKNLEIIKRIKKKLTSFTLILMGMILKMKKWKWVEIIFM